VCRETGKDLCLADRTATERGAGDQDQGFATSRDADHRSVASRIKVGGLLTVATEEMDLAFSRRRHHLHFAVSDDSLLAHMPDVANLCRFPQESTFAVKHVQAS